MSNVRKFKIYAQTLEDDTIVFTNCFVDVSQLAISHFCIPFDESGKEMEDIVKVFCYNRNTLEPKEFLFKFDKEIEVILNNFINGK